MQEAHAGEASRVLSMLTADNPRCCWTQRKLSSWSMLSRIFRNQWLQRTVRQAGRLRCSSSRKASVNLKLCISRVPGVCYHGLDTVLEATARCQPCAGFQMLSLLVSVARAAVRDWRGGSSKPADICHPSLV